MNTDQAHLQGLNAQQREAASYIDGPLLIVAGAGAGKTKTITHRIVNLIKHGIAPENILAVTFTNKAAKEMRERVIAEIEKSAKGQNSIPFVSTFHSLGVYIIKENAHLLGLTKYFTILDESDANSIIKEALKEQGIDPKMYDPKKIKNIISREKGKFVSISEYTEGSSGSTMGRIVAQIWRMYEDKKQKENALDFDDLLLKTVKLLKENEAVRKMYQERWTYIHIDEYQDTNEVQYLMSKLLAEKNKNICVVGDSDQLIYSWRGANIKNILTFEKDYPDTKIVILEENYRSTKNILEAANEVIKKNKYRPDKNLFTENKVGEKIGLYESLDETDEADFIASKILEIVDGRGEDAREGTFEKEARKAGANFSQVLGYPRDNSPTELEARPDHEKNFSSFAILYRANFQSRVLEEALLRHNIPYQVLGIKFFERKEIKDTLAYLRVALNRDSLSDMKRIINFPARGIGKVTIAKIFAGESESLPVKVRIKLNNFYETLDEICEKIKTDKASAVIKFTIKKSGIENELLSGTDEDRERLENIKELATLALKYDNLENGAGIEKLLEDASLASDQDSLIFNDEKNGRTSVDGVRHDFAKSNAVKLMTVHASKGLEFKNVFVTGMEDGLFPHQMLGDTKSPEDSEEERRLFYVAITRAKEKLFLSFANYRTIFGSRQINAPSEFLGDIPGDLLEREDERGLIKTIYL